MFKELKYRGWGFRSARVLVGVNHAPAGGGCAGGVEPLLTAAAPTVQSLPPRARWPRSKRMRGSGDAVCGTVGALIECVALANILTLKYSHN